MRVSERNVIAEEQGVMCWLSHGSGVIGSPVGCQFGGARMQDVVGDHDEPVPDSAAVDAPGSR